MKLSSLVPARPRSSRTGQCVLVPSYRDEHTDGPGTVVPRDETRPPCIYCDRSLTTGRLYFELHAGPACGRCVERRDLYDEIEPAHCAAGDRETQQ